MRTVLTLATQAPSMHNSQPWRWRVGPDSLSLFADPSRRLSHADPDRRNLLISCGATLHHCVVALAAAGWCSKVQRLPDPSDSDFLAAISVSAQPPGELDILLAGAIGRRRTDRRTYSSWPVPWGNIALMGARAARAGVLLRQVEPLLRLDLPAPTFASPALPQPDTGPAAQDNGVLVALGTPNDDDLARLRAGEATSLVLLSATALGLATCPMTEPLEIPAARDAVRADVFGASAYPQMMMRFGWAPPDAEPLPATPRRPLLDVADWLIAG